MCPIRKLAVLALAACASTVVSTAPALAQKKTKVPLDVGTVAPPLGDVTWLKLGDSSASVEPLSELRDHVVVVATYVCSHDGSRRVVIPTTKALRKANEPLDLRVVLLTAVIGTTQLADDTDDQLVAESQKLGVEGPVGWCDTDGVRSPYFDVSTTGSLGYAYVIAKNGGILWKGDPARARDEFLEAVATARNAVPSRALPAAWASDPVAPEVAPLVREYVLGDFVKCEALGQALLKKLGSKSGADAEHARAGANEVLALVDGTRKDLMEQLEKTGGAKEAEPFQRTLLHVRRAFPKGEAADRASQLELYMTMQSDRGPACKQWLDWYTLEAARPATFPAEKGPAAQKYARELGLYAKKPGVPGLDRVRTWLAAYAALD